MDSRARRKALGFGKRFSGINLRMQEAIADKERDTLLENDCSDIEKRLIRRHLAGGSLPLVACMKCCHPRRDFEISIGGICSTCWDTILKD